MHRPPRALLYATLAGFLSVGCISFSKSDSKSSSQSAASAPPWTFTSPDFNGGDPMPYEFTCNGGDFASGANPELDWTAGPAGTQSYAIVLKDISIIEKMEPTTISHGYHWAMWDIPTTLGQVPHGLRDDEFPAEVAGARQWAIRNQFGYFPPCPNSDPTVDPSLHVTDHYALTLYAIPSAIKEPEFEPDAPNYTETIDDYFKSIATQDLELLFTSDAASQAAPPALDPSTIKPPSGVGEGGASGASGAGGAAQQ